jgi:hypothetical protein
MKMMQRAVLSALVLLVPSIGSAQNKLPANFLGLTSLELSPANSGAQDDALFKSGHVGHAAADVRPALKSGRASAAPAVPALLPTPEPEEVAPGVAEVHGFNGLSHFDQRFSGTGQYANTNFSVEPPDQGLCVGNGSVMEAVNDAIAVFAPSGARIGGPMPINQFFNLAPSIIRSTPLVFGPFVGDPRCYYDAGTGRWFISVLEIDTDPTTGAFGTHASVLLAASVTSDPSGAYYLYSFDTTDGHGHREGHPNCPCFGDQPLIGADANGFYVSTNEFPITGPGFNGAQIYAMSKAALLSGGSLHVVHLNVGADVPVPPSDQANGSLWYSIQPATSPGAGSASGPGIEYFLSALAFGPPPLDNRLAVWALTNTSSLNEEEPELHLLHTVIGSQSYGMINAFAAQQKSGPTPLRDLLNATVPKENDNIDHLNANDPRMNQVVFASGDLWAGVNTNVSVGGQTRQGIAWFAVKPSLSGGQLSAQIDRQGYVAVAGEDVLFPSIGVNQNGAAVMSFTLAGPDYWPSSAYVRLTQRASDVHLVGAGVGPDDGFSGYAAYGGNGIARWGDYSAAVADESGHIWIATEYIGQTCTFDQFALDTTCGGTRSLLANWGTFIARVPTGD